MAISPETPVSISSKIRDGKALFFANKCFIESIKRLISPPEAICLNGLGAKPLFAEKSSWILSEPFAASSLAVISQAKFAFGMPKDCNETTRAVEIASKTAERDEDKAAAAETASFKSASTRSRASINSVSMEEY